MSPIRIAALFALGLGLVGCSDPPLVVQGTVTARDEAQKTLTVQDERAPDTSVVLDLGAAEIGAPPDTGDLVRVAYHLRDGKAAAVRVMNLTKQAELRASHGGH